VCLHAQAAPPPASAPIQNTGIHPGQSLPMNGIAHIAMHVTNVEKERDFYEKLGFEEAFNFKKPDGSIRQDFMKINDRQFIEIYPPDTREPLGFAHLCFDGIDLQALHDQYVAEGLTPKPVRKAGAGNLLFTMVGPENQNIEYTEYMPGSLHSNDIGKHLGPNRISTHLVAVGLGMKNEDAAMLFYAGPMEFKTAGDPHVFLVPGTSGQKVIIESLDGDNRVHIYLGVASAKAAAAELTKRGIAFEREGKSIMVRDPEGNRIELTADPAKP
jgi:catechol 2,3-dioxygenase-like lactoylglutathione lyase family enzyme